MMLPVADVDAAYGRATETGCTASMPAADMFWDDRYGQTKDPFGVIWAFNGPIKPQFRPHDNGAAASAQPPRQTATASSATPSLFIGPHFHWLTGSVWSYIRIPNN
ncbi:hypothetical protein AiwAL_12465 [Acidiphilium sp. AL]|uniref:Glyoxalase/fosfomycin resistance/dioxygenase domain-containing protein n=1 Tax=Acidiphilium iwatense TaxID=768198 RepID=A0ABS9DYA8_9PROT|nr:MULTISPECIES: VOC family protein [Acidiphilium]MCF3947664.1 hypothetical protein [Acidiphilium iwatense]MCU4160915.1 hypothetical protein [Acidiphilium sp. AL]